MMSKAIEKSNKIVEKYMTLAIGSGLISTPGNDIEALVATQLKMLADLAKHYNLPFSKDKGKLIIISLIMNMDNMSFTQSRAGALVKAIPVTGTVISQPSFPIFCSAATYAVGTVFIQHFESGGTILNFDPENMKPLFKKQFETGEQITKNSHKK